MAGEFWLSDQAWAAIRPLLPYNQPGARRVDDRRIISGIIHVLKSGCRWKDCPAVYGPHTTVYNRFNRWSRKGLWGRIFSELVAQAETPEELSIDSSAVRAHRSAHGGKGGQCSGHWPLACRPNHENPRPDRCSQADRGLLTDAGQCRRHIRRTRVVVRDARTTAPDRRQRLRRQQLAPHAGGVSNRGRHSLNSVAKEPHPIQRGRIPGTQPHRARILCAERLAAHCDPIRQARKKLPLSRRNSSINPVVDLIESRP